MNYVMSYVMNYNIWYRLTEKKSSVLSVAVGDLVNIKKLNVKLR